MCDYYPNEESRQDEALPALNYIFSVVSEMIQVIHNSTIGSVATDCHNIGGHDAVVLVTKFKNT